jgi:ATP-dependent RNA helicase UAP56/SUB2/complement component 1 Q subcomponent-binding protein
MQADKALVFECVSDGTYLDIRHVSLEPAEGIDSDTVFTGPVFSELDSELQDSFREYVAVSGALVGC